MTTLINAEGLQDAMMRKGNLEANLADEPYGPDEARTDEDYLAYFEALDIEAGDTFVDTDGVTGDVVAVVPAFGGMNCELHGRDECTLVHIQFPEDDGGYTVFDDWQIGSDAARYDITVE